MAVRQARPLERDSAVSGGDLASWARVSDTASLELDVDRVRNVVDDVGSWPVWHPYLTGAELIEGNASEPGSLYRIEFGFSLISVPVLSMLIQRNRYSWVFAGGRGGWRFIETFRLLPVRKGTRLDRTLEVRIPQRLALLRWPIERLARLHLTAAASSFT